MRSSPLNYLVALVISAVLVGISLSVLGDAVGNNVELPDGTDMAWFTMVWRTVIGLLGACGWISSIAWFAYGGSQERAHDIKAAVRTFNLHFFVQLAVGLLGAIVLLFMLKISGSFIILYFVLGLLHTMVAFWVSSLVATPERVKYTVLGMR
jgi:hypothetical protein